MCLYVCMHACTHVCMCELVCMTIFLLCSRERVFVSVIMCVCSMLAVHMYACMYACMYVCMHACIRGDMQERNIDVYIYIYMKKKDLTLHFLGTARPILPEHEIGTERSNSIDHQFFAFKPREPNSRPSSPSPRRTNWPPITPQHPSPSRGSGRR